MFLKDSVWNLGSLLRSSMGEPWWCFWPHLRRGVVHHSQPGTPNRQGFIGGSFESLYNSLVLKGTLLCSRVFWQNGLSSRPFCRLQSSHCLCFWWVSLHPSRYPGGFSTASWISLWIFSQQAPVCSFEVSQPGFRVCIKGHRGKSRLTPLKPPFLLWLM